VSDRTADLAVLDQHLPKTLALWRRALREPVDAADVAAILKKLIKGKLQCFPAVSSEGKGDFVITGEGTLVGALPHNLASPAGGRDTYEPGHREAYEWPLGGTVRKAA
jgi:hypothetical protein